MAAATSLNSCLLKLNLNFEDFYKEFFNERIDSNDLDVGLLTALKKSANSLRYWGKRFDVLQDKCRLLLTTFSPNAGVGPSILDILKAVAKVFDIKRIKEVHIPENRNYLGLEFHSPDDLNFVKTNFKEFDQFYIVYVHWLAEAKVYAGKIHWLPSSVPIEKVGELLNRYFIIKDLKKAQIMIEENVFINLNVIMFSGLLRVGFSLDNVPHITDIMNSKVLITMKGRAPLCLKCKKTGHIRNECPYIYCSTCKMDLMRSHSCKLFGEIVTYADVSSGMRSEQIKKVSVEEKDLDNTTDSLIQSNDDEWIEVRRHPRKHYGKIIGKPLNLDMSKEHKSEPLNCNEDSNHMMQVSDENINHQAEMIVEDKSMNGQQLKRKLSDENVRKESWKIGSASKTEEVETGSMAMGSPNLFDILESDGDNL